MTGLACGGGKRGTEEWFEPPNFTFSLGTPKAVVSWGGGGLIRWPCIFVLGGEFGSSTLDLTLTPALALPLALPFWLILLPSHTLALTLGLVLTLPLSPTITFPFALALTLTPAPTLTLTLPLILPLTLTPTVLCRGWGRGSGLDWGGARAGSPPRGGGPVKKSHGRLRRQSGGVRRVGGARCGGERVRREGCARKRGSEVERGVLQVKAGV